MLAIAAGLAMPLAVCAAWICAPIPAAIIARASGHAVRIEDRTGRLLRSTRSADGSQEQWVSYDRIDPDVINAFVAVEDRRFWAHHGIDSRAVVRAMRDNLFAGHVTSGASTITMQLARLLRPAPRHWGGKVMQAMWALRLEAHLTKAQILEQYLNRVQLGQATAGVGAASALYFNASAAELSIGQAATLAGLAHAPSRDNPYASPRRAGHRRAYALRRMRQLGYATRDDIARVRDERLRVPSATPAFLAPHFTTRVLSWLRDDEHTVERACAARAATRDDRCRATIVTTSLDADLQLAIEAEVRHTVDMLHDRGVEEAAAVVLDNASGEVRAWVGSPDFWAAGDGQTDMVMSARQPGSALKPFLYGLALDRGVTAATVLPDLPKTYATPTGSYSPRNYDRRFRGPVRAREALASSYNVPAVELASQVSAASLLNTLHEAGFASLDRDAEFYGLGLTLGNGDVTLIELANGYRALAMDGVWHPWTWRASNDGTRGTGDSRRVISPVASAIVLDMLNDPVARIPGFGLQTPFDFPFPVAVKTGTSRHFTDNWAVATTRGFTVAVWAGNFNGRPMQGVSGVTGAGPLLHRVVMETAKRIAPGAFTTPAEVGARPVSVCRLSGLRATAGCPQLTEWFAPGTEPAAVDDWEQGGQVALPVQYANWVRQQSEPPMILRESSVAASAGQGSATPHERARFVMTSPRDGDRYEIPAGVEAQYATIALRAGGPGAQRVRWWVDGRAHEAGRWTLTEGEHVLRATSALGASVEAKVVVLK